VHRVSERLVELLTEHRSPERRQPDRIQGPGEGSEMAPKTRGPT
jgi:hypothetical protein